MTSGKMKIIIAGPAYPYRGGIAAFNERLARELIQEGHEVRLVTFTLQYPSFLFPGKTQYSDSPAPEGLPISRKINSINPLNWIRTGLELRKEKADLIVAAFWLPYMAPCLGTICRIAGTTAVGLVHNLIPHEKKMADTLLARYFCNSMDRFVTLSDSVLKDIRRFSPAKSADCCPHPLYDNFGEAVCKEEACRHLGLDPDERILLSFGLIRDYKGLDWLLEAFASLKSRKGIRLMISGEFYTDGSRYHEMARRLGIDDEIVWNTSFIPDDEVRYHFCAADLVVQPYKSATQSGVTQIAYHFERPMLVTRVGGLSETVPDRKCGYAVEPSPAAVAEALEEFISKSPDFSEALKEEKKKYSWSRLCGTLTR